MTKLLFLLVALGCNPALAQSAAQGRALPELRFALQQVNAPGAGVVRQLSPQERAELRRQVAEVSRPSGKGP